MSVFDWIESRVPGGHSSRMGQLLDVAYNTEYGADTTEQSSLNLIYLLAFQPTGSGFAILGQSDERYHLVGGNEGLPRAIAASLPSSSLKLNTSLTRIAQNGDGTFALRFRDKSSQFTVRCGPRHPRDSVFGAAHARLRTGGIPCDQTGRDRAARVRQQREAASPVQPAPVEHLGAVGPQHRQQLRRHRLPKHVGCDPRTAGIDRHPGQLHRRQRQRLIQWRERVESRERVREELSESD